MPQVAKNVRAVDLPVMDDPGDVSSPEEMEEASPAVPVDAEPSLSMADVYRSIQEAEEGRSEADEATEEDPAPKRSAAVIEARRKLAEMEAAEAARGAEPAAAEGEAPAGKSADAAAIDPQLVNKAREYDLLDTALRQNPAAVLKSFMAVMSPEQRTAFFAEHGAAPGVDPGDPEAHVVNGVDLRNLTDQEALVEKNRDWVTQGKSQVLQMLQARDSHLGHALVNSEVAKLQLQAVAKELGLTLPDPDLKAIGEAMRAGKTPAQAVADNYKIVAPSREAPTTPRNSSGQPPQLRKGASMAEIMRHIRMYGDAG